MRSEYDFSGSRRNSYAKEVKPVDSDSLGTDDTPILRAVRGVLKTADIRDYWKHIAEKTKPK
jgi:hypothetical protein